MNANWIIKRLKVTINCEELPAILPIVADKLIRRKYLICPR